MAAQILAFVEHGFWQQEDTPVVHFVSGHGVIGNAAAAPGGPGETGSIAETVTVSDVISGLSAKAALQMEDAAFVDTFSAIGSYAKTLTDSVEFTDQFIGATSTTEILNDGFSMSDVISSLAFYQATVAENVDFGDTIDGDTSKKTIGMEDFLTLGDTFITKVSYRQTLSDNVMFGDFFQGMTGEAEGVDIERVIQDVVRDSVQEVIK